MPKNINPFTIIIILEGKWENRTWLITTKLSEKSRGRANRQKYNLARHNLYLSPQNAPQFPTNWLMIIFSFPNDQTRSQGDSSHSHLKGKALRKRDCKWKISEVLHKRVLWSTNIRIRAKNLYASELCAIKIFSFGIWKHLLLIWDLNNTLSACWKNIGKWNSNMTTLAELIKKIIWSTLCNFRWLSLFMASPLPPLHAS